MPYKVMQDLCNCCGICINACPVEAISYRDGYAYIDQNQCLDCGSCENECPIGQIIPVDFN